VCRVCLTHSEIIQNITNCKGPGSNHENSANVLEAVKKNTHTNINSSDMCISSVDDDDDDNGKSKATPLLSKRME